MNILHVTAGIQETCGVSRFVMETARAQMREGHRVCVATTMTCGYPVGEIDVRLLSDPTRVDFKPNIVHLHSIWNLYVHRMAIWSRQMHIPYIISPHGALTSWALRYHWWKKLPALLLYQYYDLRKASVFHVTTSEETVDVQRLFLRQPVCVAPLGVELQSKADKPDTNKDILFLSRIHPKKNIASLLVAWNAIPTTKRIGWRLIIAGPDDIGHQQELKELAIGLGLRVRDFSGELEFGKKQIHGGNEVPLSVYQEKISQCDADVVFTGPVYGETKDWLYQEARYFILPSHSENFGVVVIEALAARTPCITTKGTPWASLPKHGCGWWVDDSVESLKDTLNEALTLNAANYAQMSKTARSYVEKNYSWSNTAQTLIEAYQNILKT